MGKILLERADLLDLLRIGDDGYLWWRDKDDPVMRESRTAYKFRGERPRGVRAGGRTVHGHGPLIKLGSFYCLTSDCRSAIADGYMWPWDLGKTAWALDLLEPVDTDRLRATIGLDGDGKTLVWLADTRHTVAGSPVAGTHIDRETPVRAASLGGVFYVFDDLRAWLITGDWPWEAGW